MHFLEPGGSPDSFSALARVPAASRANHRLSATAQDVFVHISAVEKAGLSSLNEGAKVSYEEMENRGKTSAENPRVG
jgi:cold shock CspA family protein